MCSAIIQKMRNAYSSNLFSVWRELWSRETHERIYFFFSSDRFRWVTARITRNAYPMKFFYSGITFFVIFFIFFLERNLQEKNIIFCNFLGIFLRKKRQAEEEKFFYWATRSNFFWCASRIKSSTVVDVYSIWNLFDKNRKSARCWHMSSRYGWLAAVLGRLFAVKYRLDKLLQYNNIVSLPLEAESVIKY